MKASQENYDRKSHLTHVEREQVDIRADIKIIQHDIITLKDNMATKSDIALLKSEMSNIRTELKAEVKVLETKFNHLEAKLEDGFNSIKKLLNVVFLAIGTLVIALIPIMYDMLKTFFQK